MSDFAVGFYEILYQNLLDSNHMLDKYGNLINFEFAGDTMNSFETTANRTPGAGKAKVLRTPESEWPEYLREYAHSYHCLANFWVLPMETGRSIQGKLNKARRALDYMDRYLLVLYDEVKFDGEERFYHNCFQNWQDFLDTHFLQSGYLEGDTIRIFSQGTAEEFIRGAIKAMEGRAKDIAKSKYAEPLWAYFDRNGLIQ